MNNGKICVQVVGVGGGGGNAVNHIAQHGTDGIEFVAVNTDVQALNALQGPRTFQIGADLTGGYGSGARPDIGRQAAEEDAERLRELVHPADLVFLAAGLGGGTGTGATPVIAKVAKELGALTVAVVTKPFGFEGEQRMRVAEAGLIELRQTVDTVVCVPNDRVLKLCGENVSVAEAFRMTDEVLNQAVTAIGDLISHVGIINIDYGDIATVVKEPGEALVGFGEASGENYATKAVRYALASHLLERSDIVGAKKVLLSIVAGRDVSMKDVQEALQCVNNEVRGEANVVFGVILRDDMQNKGKVTLIATGLPDVKRSAEAKPKRVQISPLKAHQADFDFLPADTGRFANLEPTLIEGVNYDTPTFIRWGRKLLSDAV